MLLLKKEASDIYRFNENLINIFHLENSINNLSNNPKTNNLTKLEKIKFLRSTNQFLSIENLQEDPERCFPMRALVPYIGI